MDDKKQWEFEWFFITEVQDPHRRKGIRAFVVNDKNFTLKKTRIRWHDGLECYTFQTNNQTSWNTQALRDIALFLEERTEEDKPKEEGEEDGSEDQTNS